MTDDISGRIRRKLVEIKERWAVEDRLITGRAGDPAKDRLPPGQRLTRDWPVLDLGVQPDIPTERWRLEIGGLVEHPQSLDWAGFLALPQSEIENDIHCVTSWSRYDNVWQGVSTRDVAALVAPRAEARFVLFTSFDSYTTNVPLDDFLSEGALLAHHWQQDPIPRQHGGPVRVVIPKLYFWKSAKWVSRIEFSATDKPGFWEMRGYHNHGDPWTEERYG